MLSRIYAKRKLYLAIRDERDSISSYKNTTGHQDTPRWPAFDWSTLQLLSPRRSSILVSTAADQIAGTNTMSVGIPAVVR